MLDSKRSVGTTHTSRQARRTWWLTCAFVTAALAIAGVGVRAGGSTAQGSLAAADRMQQKLEAIVRFGAIPRLETQATVIEEGEVNAYMAYYLTSEIPSGIAPPTLRILGGDRLAASTTLDIDAMNASRPVDNGFDPLRLLSGTLGAKVSGRLVTENGSGRFQLESAELGGIPLPRAVVSQLVARYDVNIDDPFDLPSSIRELRIEPGKVTVLQ